MKQSQSDKNQRQRIQCLSACFRQKTSTDERCHFGMRRSRPRSREQAKSKRTDTGTVDDYETPCPPSKLGLGSQTPLETSLAPCSETLPKETTCWTTPLALATWSECSQETNKRFWHPGVVISNTLVKVWIAYRGSVVKGARSQVRPFHEDDVAADEHVTEHMKKLGERPLQDHDFSYEDITGQDEPPVDSTPAPGEKRSDQRSQDPAETIARKNQNCQHATTNRSTFQRDHRYCTTIDSGRP